MKHFSLSQISIAFALAYAALPAVADIQSANQQTQVSRQGGVEVINIAKPSASGLSHNQYQKFNVDKGGAVLNNAQRAGKSELAGQLQANSNLRQGSANVILNEVVSRQPSTIAGKQEIFGQRADYVLANPNGISVQGGGFINTAKASLVVGKPTVQQGNLTGFDVNGKGGLNTAGKLEGQLDQLDLIAPVVNIQGEVKGANSVNVIGGKNRIDRSADGQLTINVQKASGAVLDGKVFGSIQADRIRIHSTDERATLSLTGADLNGKDTVISAANAQFSGKVENHTKNSDRSYTADKNVKTQESHSERTQTVKRTTVNSESLVIDVADRLSFSATDLNAKQAIVSGGHTHLGGQTTTDSTVSTSNKSKGSWYRNDSNVSSSQTFHRTTIAVEDLTLASTKGAIVGDAVKIDSQNALFFAEQGVEFKGKNQRNQKNLESNFRNETAKLKTGRNYVNSDEEVFAPTELNIAENLRIGGKGEVKFSGVTGKVDGNLLVESGKKVAFTSQTSRVKREIDDQEKYWGGIGGSNSGMASVNELAQHGSDIQVKGLAYVDAKEGVQISGSRVLAGEGYVRGHQGKLSIDSVDAKTTAQTASRTGTVFNITKSRNEAFSSVTTAQGSTLKSDSNLHLLSDNQIDVVGSKVAASGVLDVVAKKVNVSGAQNRSESSESSYQFGFTKKSEKDKAQMNIEGLVNEVIDTWLDGREIKNPIKLFWDHRKHRTEKSITLGSQQSSEKVTETTHSASQVAGGDLRVKTDNLALKGSQLQATTGNALVDAKQIQTMAQTDSKTVEKHDKTVGLTAGFRADNKGTNVYLRLGGEGKRSTDHTENAQTSAVEAVGNVVLNATKIVHQGSTLNAQNGRVVETAETVRHEAAQTTNFSNSQNVKAGITASVQVDKKFKHTYGLEIGGEGGRESLVETKNTLTKVNSGKDIVVSGNQITDVGTQYQAGNNVYLNSVDHRIQSAVEHQHSDKMSAGAKVGLAIETNGDGDKSSASLKVSLGANYQQNQGASTKVQQANVQGKNVYVTTDNLNGQGNIKAEENVRLDVKNDLNFTQSTETNQKAGGGFKAELAVGGIVKGGAAIPSVDLALSANGEKGHGSQAVMNNISGKQVVVNAGGVNRLQGTNINGESVYLGGQTVSVAAGENHGKLNAGSAGVSVAVGKGGSSVKAEGKFSVNVEKETAHTTAEINAKDLTIASANGVRLDGVQATAEIATVDSGNGDLVLNALKNQTHKTGVAASLGINGDIKDKQWQGKGGNASLDVNVVRNDTHTGSSITANNVNLNVNGNVALNGSAITANQVNGNVTGNVISTSATDKIKETSVSLSASGSGKFTPYPTVKLPLALKKDWDKGAIFGIKAEANYAVNATRKQRGLPTGVISPNNRLNVGGYTNVAPTAATGGYSYATQGGFTTNLKQRYYLPWRKQQFGQ